MLNKLEIQTLGQLVDNIDIALSKLEEAYNDKDSKNFEKAKKEILEFNKKIMQTTG